MIESEPLSKEKIKDPFARTADRVLKDFHNHNPENEKREVESEKRKVVLKGIDPRKISLDENIRKNLDQNSIEFKRLVESVRQHGILQSILVEERHLTEGEIKFICVEGHRRILAAIIVGLSAVPALVKTYQSLAVRKEEALAADTKEFLSPIDRAEAYLFLQENGRTVDEIARYHSRDVRTIERYLKMAGWSAEVKELVRSNPEIFSVRTLIHSFVQKNIPQNELLLLMKQKTESTKTESQPHFKSKKLKENNKNKDDFEININSKLLALMLQKNGVQVNLRQSAEDIIATLHFSPTTLKNLVEQLQKIQSENSPK